MCDFKGSTWVSKMYPKKIGEMVKSKGKKSIDLYLEPEYVMKLKSLLADIEQDKVLHLILMDVTEERSAKKIQMLVESCDHVPQAR